MKYLIVQDWQSTHGNHAGMVHMCKLLKEKWPDEYEVYIKPQPRTFNKIEGNGIVARAKRWINAQRAVYYKKKVYPKEYLELCNPMFKKLEKGDEVFLLEYLIPWCSQYELACYIRKYYPSVKIYALSHLTVKYFKETVTLNNPNIVRDWSIPIDKMLTLGTSLSEYFIANGVEESKINTGFHYVDSDYYHKKKDDDGDANKPLTVITMGALQRDYSLLAEVVSKCPNIHWIICKGRKNVDDLFPSSDNIELKGYLSEDELRDQMDRADVSLNIMEDTIGSNVITTSMAMGLAMVVTDVGSIRDYCDESNALFCKIEKEDIASSILFLSSHREIVQKMKKSSKNKSKSFSIINLHSWLSNL